jgi:hypothetical protein
MSRKKSRYSGDLTRPIDIKEPGLLATDEQRQDYRKQVTGELMQRMLLLCAEHEVEQRDWFALALSLAVENVPGMRLPSGKRPGRPMHWKPLDLAMLAMVIEEVQAAVPGATITDTVKVLAGVEPWKSKCAHSSGAKRLRNEYTKLDELTRKLVPMLRDHRQHLIDQGEITESLSEFARKYLYPINAHHEPDSEQ